LISVAVSTVTGDAVFGDNVALWIIFIVYGFVIANNTFFLLKYSGVL
jgi:hypothetical protein